MAGEGPSEMPLTGMRRTAPKLAKQSMASKWAAVMEPLLSLLENKYDTQLAAVRLINKGSCVSFDQRIKTINIVPKQNFMDVDAPRRTAMYHTTRCPTARTLRVRVHDSASIANYVAHLPNEALRHITDLELESIHPLPGTVLLLLSALKGLRSIHFHTDRYGDYVLAYVVNNLPQVTRLAFPGFWESKIVVQQVVELDLTKASASVGIIELEQISSAFPQLRKLCVQRIGINDQRGPATSVLLQVTHLMITDFTASSPNTGRALHSLFPSLTYLWICFLHIDTCDANDIEDTLQETVPDRLLDDDATAPVSSTCCQQAPQQGVQIKHLSMGFFGPLFQQGSGAGATAVSRARSLGRVVEWLTVNMEYEAVYMKESAGASQLRRLLSPFLESTRIRITVGYGREMGDQERARFEGHVRTLIHGCVPEVAQCIELHVCVCTPHSPKYWD